MQLTQIATSFSNFLFLGMVAGIPLYAAIKGVKVFDTFVDGAKDGIRLMVKILPYFVGMLVAIGMLRASGAFELFASWFAPFLKWLGMPADLLPLALIRPFSGQASNGMVVELIQQHGADSYIGNAAATIMGSTETTFYVIAIYFGAVHIKRTRHAIPAGLLADLTGIFAAVWVCHYFW